MSLAPYHIPNPHYAELLEEKELRKNQVTNAKNSLEKRKQGQ